MNTYSISKTTKYTFGEAVEKTRQSLANQGFGVLTEINVKETLKKKLDVDYDDYIILGACNPHKAYRALQAEKEIGLLLPCNVIIYSIKGSVTISAISPVAIISIMNNSKLSALASDVEELLGRVIERI